MLHDNRTDITTNIRAHKYLAISFPSYNARTLLAIGGEGANEEALKLLGNLKSDADDSDKSCGLASELSVLMYRYHIVFF